MGDFVALWGCWVKICQSWRRWWCLKHPKPKGLRRRDQWWNIILIVIFYRPPGPPKLNPCRTLQNVQMYANICTMCGFEAQTSGHFETAFPNAPTGVCFWLEDGSNAHTVQRNARGTKSQSFLILIDYAYIRRRHLSLVATICDGQTMVNTLQWELSWLFVTKPEQAFMRNPQDEDC
jgi:hypothetical protein